MNARIQSLESERPGAKKKTLRKTEYNHKHFLSNRIFAIQIYASVCENSSHTHETKTEIEIACYKTIYILFSSRYVRAESKK